MPRSLKIGWCISQTREYEPGWRYGPSLGGAWVLASAVGFAVAAALAVVILATLLRESFIAPAACALGGVAYGVATATWIVAFSDATAPPP
jgi:hypothetical protein